MREFQTVGFQIHVHPSQFTLNENYRSFVNPKGSASATSKATVHLDLDLFKSNKSGDLWTANLLKAKMHKMKHFLFGLI